MSKENVWTQIMPLTKSECNKNAKHERQEHYRQVFYAGKKGKNGGNSLERGRDTKHCEKNTGLKSEFRF